MQLHETEENGVCVMGLKGEIDLYYAPVLRNLLKGKAKAHCAMLILDFSGVSFIDSTGLAAVIEYIRDAAEFAGRLCISDLQEHVRAVFQIVNLDTVIPIFPNVEAAKAAWREQKIPPAGELLFHKDKLHASRRFPNSSSHRR